MYLMSRKYFHDEVKGKNFAFQHWKILNRTSFVQEVQLEVRKSTKNHPINDLGIDSACCNKGLRATAVSYRLNLH